MKYCKPALTFEQQADQLLTRGMQGNRALMIERLRVVNYYRLSGYWYPYRLNGRDEFRPNTTFEAVWQRYVFDRQLRLLVMDAIERVEVAVRTQLAYHIAHRARDPFAYVDDPTVLPGLTADDRTRLQNTLEEDLIHSKETFVKHFRNKYGTEHQHMPVWMACEIMTFGGVLTLYRGSRAEVRRSVAEVFQVHDSVLDSWLLALNTIRNICAHHGRLWNRELGIKPMIPNKAQEWHVPVEVTNERIFGIMTVCQYCLARVAPQSKWCDRWRSLLRSFPYIPRGSMGMPTDWQDCPIWLSEAGRP